MANEKNKNTEAVLIHLSGFLLGFIIPLIVFLVTENKTIKEHSKRALNWQFSLFIYMIISTILIIIIIGLLGIVILLILNTVFMVIAAIKASDGQLWDYPLSIKFLK
jgi:uncharacterized Tic20 family protein